MSAKHLCPCCGQTLPDDFKAVALKAGMSQREKELFLRIADAKGLPISWHDLFDNLYGEDAEGGPLWSSQTIRALVMRCNRKLEGTGYRILNTWGVGYRLASVNTVEAAA